MSAAQPLSRSESPLTGDKLGVTQHGAKSAQARWRATAAEATQSAQGLSLERRRILNSLDNLSERLLNAASECSERRMRAAVVASSNSGGINSNSTSGLLPHSFIRCGN